jgi:hypothetical protein
VRRACEPLSPASFRSGWIPVRQAATLQRAQPPEQEVDILPQSRIDAERRAESLSSFALFAELGRVQCTL